MASADDLTFRIRSNYEFKVQVAFYSESRNVSWPEPGKAWNLDDFMVHEFKLSCIPGEKICYGAWVTGDATQYWGVGNRNRTSCSNCCSVCGQGNMTPVLNLDDD
jgi:hypothetical protein